MFSCRTLDQVDEVARNALDEERVLLARLDDEGGEVFEKLIQGEIRRQVMNAFLSRKIELEEERAAAEAEAESYAGKLAQWKDKLIEQLIDGLIGQTAKDELRQLSGATIKAEYARFKAGVGKIHIRDDIYHFLSLSQNISLSLIR